MNCLLKNILIIGVLLSVSFAIEAEYGDEYDGYGSYNPVTTTIMPLMSTINPMYQELQAKLNIIEKILRERIVSDFKTMEQALARFDKPTVDYRTTTMASGVANKELPFKFKRIQPDNSFNYFNLGNMAKDVNMNNRATNAPIPTYNRVGMPYATIKRSQKF